MGATEDAAALDLARQRRLSPVPVQGGWIVRTAAEQHLRPPTGAWTDITEAITAAVALLDAEDDHRQDRRAVRLFRALSVGEWFVRPRKVQQTDDLGQPVTVTLWDVRVANTANDVIQLGVQSLPAALIRGARWWDEQQ